MASGLLRYHFLYSRREKLSDRRSRVYLRQHTRRRRTAAMQCAVCVPCGGADAVTLQPVVSLHTTFRRFYEHPLQ